MADGIRENIVGTVEAGMAEGGRMTDHADLIARLRDLRFVDSLVRTEAADALESIAQECAKLREQVAACEQWKQTGMADDLRLVHAENLALRERVAALTFDNERIVCDLATSMERSAGVPDVIAERDTAIRERDAAQQDAAQYKKAWERRGLALARPCMKCGYVQHEIKPAAPLKDKP